MKISKHANYALDYSRQKNRTKPTLFETYKHTHMENEEYNTRLVAGGAFPGEKHKFSLSFDVYVIECTTHTSLVTSPQADLIWKNRFFQTRSGLETNTFCVPRRLPSTYSMVLAFPLRPVLLITTATCCQVCS